MPAPIIDGLITFITTQLPITVWDGEIPRYATTGTPISPSAAVVVPSTWPAIKCYMEESGFNREWTTEDPYTDTGEIHLLIWSTTRVSAESTMNTLEALLAQAASWAQVQLGGPAENPFYIIQMLLLRWYSGQEEEIRTGLSQLLYRCDLHYEVMIHGILSTA